MPIARIFNQLVRRPAAVKPIIDPSLSRHSNLAGTAYKRHVQSLHETGGLRNPDVFAGALLSAAERQQCLALGNDELGLMRADAYYYYLLARTRFYDQVLLDAVAAGARRVVVLGAGYDTRLYRFGGHLAACGVSLAEADQPDAVAHKQVLAAPLPMAERVRYLAIDLNQQSTWANTWEWLARERTPALIYAEGVSPYIEGTVFMTFLAELAQRLPVGSQFAYDFKIKGADDTFGKDDAVEAPLRWSLDAAALADQHQRVGFSTMQLQTSLDLMQSQVPSWSPAVSPLFTQDAALRLAV